jgi:hypothetical protein
MAYSTISKPSLYFNTKLYSGNGTTNHNITGVGFQPDLVWTKGRSGSYGVSNHKLADAVRGAGKIIHANLNDAEYDQSGATGATIGFISDGFTLGTNSNSNNSSTEYVSWNWKAGGTTSSNTDGDITSTVSVNTTAGFSIVSYTGNGSTNQTVGHGLGVKPAVMIFKNRDDTNNWVVYHHKLNNGTNPEVKYLELNTTNAQLDDASIFNDTAPTSTLFTIGNASDTGSGSGGNNEKIIAYCFTEKKGFSKFGNYDGNGDAGSAPFVYTGFKPAFVMSKRTDSSGNSWRMFDNKRDGFNGDMANLHANLSNAEDSGSDGFMDFYSNGFRPRTTSTDQNAAGAAYIYMAFAEEPLVANVGASIPATAR